MIRESRAPSRFRSHPTGPETSRPRPGRPAGARCRRSVGLALCLALGLALSSCSSLQFDRTTKTSGTFVSKGTSFTFLGWDLPMRAVDIARENASDARVANLQVDEVRVWPYLGWFDWVAELLFIRKATITGTWGFDGDQTGV